MLVPQLPGIVASHSRGNEELHRVQLSWRECRDETEPERALANSGCRRGRVLLCVKRLSRSN